MKSKYFDVKPYIGLYARLHLDHMLKFNDQELGKNNDNKEWMVW